jgi:hypothetical protein
VIDNSVELTSFSKLNVENLAEDTDKHRQKDINKDKRSSEYENQEKIEDVNAEQLT